MRKPGDVYPSDEVRRKIKPHVRVHHSITNHPRTAAIWQDNDLLARWLRVMMAASEKGAAHTGDRLELRYNELPDCMGVTRVRHARDVLLTLCCHLGWPLRWQDGGRTVQITIRNFAKKQNIAPRQNGVAPRDPARSPLPTPHSPEKKDIVAAQLLLSASPNGGPAQQVTVPEILEAWRRVCVPLGASDVRELTATRVRKLKIRIREHPRFDWWDELFSKITASRFLFGNGTRGWRVTLDWLIENDANAVKVLEGRYEQQ